MNASCRKQFPFFSTIDTLRTSQPRPSGLDLFKYVLRGLFALRAHNTWTAFLLRGIGGGQTRAQAQPHLLWKLQRPYLTSKAGLREKLTWLRAHHDWMEARLPAAMVAQLYRRGEADLARHTNTAGDVEYLWCLAFEPQFAKEGELILKLVRRANGRDDRLVALAFTVYCERGHCIAHIGCLQGPSSPQGADWIRQATKDFHGLRPMVAAVAGLLALCAHTGLDQIHKPTGAMDLRMIALSRILLDNFDHIKAYWIMLGLGTAQAALAYGADDIDGTVVHETIYHAAGSDSPQELTVRDLRRLIEEAGRTPVERDTLYNEVVRARPAEKQWATGRKLEVVG